MGAKKPEPSEKKPSQIGDRRESPKRVLTPQSRHQLDRIDHVVVLMLENRSFDNMLGWLYQAGEDFDGLTGEETNPGPDGKPVKVFNKTPPGVDALTLPNPDPGEAFDNMNEQIFHPNPPGPADTATMQGFVVNYAKQPGPPPPVPGNIMHYFVPEQLPVTSQLAYAFGVCDRWHASSPTETMPNRFFTHTGTAGGWVNDLPLHFPYMMPTIFNRFSGVKWPKGSGWKVYHKGLAMTALLSWIWPDIDQVQPFEQFCEDASAGKLPAYSFIEPRYYPDLDLGLMPDDQHPPYDVTPGERLIAEVYNHLRGARSDAWERTLLIVTYDEHGGCYDHVPPPAAVPPDLYFPEGFQFDRYGVRVPALLISPFVPAGSVIRPDPSGPPFDHTSIIKTLRERFDLGGPLTWRDYAAPSLGFALSLTPGKLNYGPERIELPETQAPIQEVTLAAEQPLTDLQRAVIEMTMVLPRSGNFEKTVYELLTGWVPSEMKRFTTPAESVAHAKQLMKTAVEASVRG